MFRLFDKTRRRLCLTAFAGLCLLPTAVVVCWCVAWQLPSHVRYEGQRLGGLLGLDVSLEGLEHLRPGDTCYRGVKFADPETGRTVLRCRQLETIWSASDNAPAPSRPVLLLAVSQAELEAAGTDRLWQLLQRAMQGQVARPEVEVRLTADQVMLHLADGAHTLTGWEGSLDVLSGGVQAQASFQLQGHDAKEPIHLRVVRNRQLTPPADGLELDTGTSALPAPLLAMLLPELAALGPEGRFCGRFYANHAADGWQGNVNGRWLGVDLARLTGDHYPHRVSGTADVALEYARFQRGRLDEAAGSLAAGPGLIGRSLVQSAAEHLHLPALSQPGTSAELLPYTQLALAFRLDGHGVALRGLCSTPQSGVVLLGAAGTLLGEPGSPQPIAQLVETFTAGQEVLLPVSRETDWLSRYVPLPDTRPAQSASRETAHRHE